MSEFEVLGDSAEVYEFFVRISVQFSHTSYPNSIVIGEHAVERLLNNGVCRLNDFKVLASDLTFEYVFFCQSP